VALAKADQSELAGVFAVIFIINRALMAIWRQ